MTTPVSEAVFAASDVRLAYANGTVALDGATVSIPRGGFVSIVGPSGCGKSTLLKMAAGLVRASAGHVETLAARTSFVFQFPTLLPWRTVEENVGLPLELHGGQATGVADLLALVGLREFGGSFPRELSGGMQMRAALARALVTKPDLLLLDEPFGALDEITRQTLNEELLRLWERDRWTALFVTHNVSEAVFLSERVLVMSARPGRIVASFDIPFPHPRDPDLRSTPAFASLAGRISHALREAAS